MGKFTLDKAITKDIKKAVADSYTDNLQMVDISEIAPNKDNFYSLRDIETLADDIERQGLKHNLVVVENARAGIKSSCKYTIISGHRRYNAIKLLIEQRRRTSAFVPVYVDCIAEDEIMLNLIMLNATSRTMSDSEVFEQYKKLDEAFRKLEAAGKKTDGRLRERIADIMKVSPAQVGKIENIQHNAIPEIAAAVEDGRMSISTANEVAKLEEEEQHQLLENNSLSAIKHKDVKAIRNEKTIEDTKPEKAEPKIHLKKPAEFALHEDDTEVFEESPIVEDKSIVENFQQAKSDIDFEIKITAKETKVLLKIIEEAMQKFKLENPFEYSQLKSIKEKLN